MSKKTSKDARRLAEGMQKVVEKHESNVAEFGWSVQAVFGDPSTGTPSFAYTIGLSHRGVPDILVLGLPAEAALPILNEIARQLIEDESKTADGTLLHKVANLPLKVAAADQAHAQYFAKMSQSYAETQGIDATFVQIILPDAKGLFPGDPGCDHKIKMMQDMRMHLPAADDRKPPERDSSR